MRYIELRRHSLRIRPHHPLHPQEHKQEHLSQEGVDLARRVGACMLTNFSRVISSPSPRAIETAIAMGFAIDELYEPVSFTDQEYQILAKLLPESMPFVDRAAMMRENTPCSKFAQALKSQWEQIARSLADETAALVITHGGYIDSSAVACLPMEYHTKWGPLFSHCEGIVMAYENETFHSGQLIRVRD